MSRLRPFVCYPSNVFCSSHGFENGAISLGYSPGYSPDFAGAHSVT